VTNRAGKTLVQYQSDRMMMPASNQKLLTCGYAVSKLGWNYRHSTRIWRRDHELWIQAGNDPLLKSTDLIAAAARKYPSVKVVLPYSQQYGAGWEIDDRGEPYLPRVSPLTVDDGIHLVRYSAGRWWLEPPNRELRLKVTGTDSTAKALYHFDANELTVSGSSEPEKPIQIPQSDPVGVAMQMVAETGEVGQAVPPNPSDVTIIGRPLVDAVRICMVESDNRIAEMLLMSAGGQLTISESAKAMEKFWLSQGVRAGEIRAVDGSGLSRHNLVTPRAMVKAMQLCLSKGFLRQNALVTPGRGTLRSRFIGLRFAGKTGTLDTVTCITGFLQDQGLIVSVLVNHAVSPVRSAMAAVDRFVKGLSSYYAAGTKNAIGHSNDPYLAEQSDHAPHADRFYRLGRHRDAAFAGLDR